MKRKATFAALLAAAATLQAQNNLSEVWVPDYGNGQYKNPIIHADYSDPDVCRVGDDYYMTASSFNCLPGLPILHSKDLVNWTLINHAVQRLEPAEMFDVPSHGNGIWAPAIRHHNGEFYIYWGDPDNGIYMVKTKDIRGHWEKPVLVKAAKGIIDTCPFWDDNGKAYIVHGFAGSRAGLKSVLGLIEMTPDGTQTIGEDRLIFDGHDDNPTIEGPKMYKRDGYYYILCPAGGVSTGWQLAMRSKTIDGPYEYKTVMAQENSNINGPHQGALVDTPDGKEFWFIHFQDVDAYGRVVHLNPVTWTRQWPVIGVDKNGDLCGEPVSIYHKPSTAKQERATPADSDYFLSTRLGLQWQWPANPNALWYFADKANNKLRLFSAPVPKNYRSLWDVQNLLLQKFPAPEFTATAKVSFSPSKKYNGERAGLVVMGMDYAALVMQKTSGGIVLTQNTCRDAHKGQTEESDGNGVAIVEGQDLWLRVSVTQSGKQAVCQFSMSTDGKSYTPMGDKFEAKPGRWIGAKVGLFVTRENIVTNDGGWMDVDEFVISK